MRRGTACSTRYRGKAGNCHGEKERICDHHRVQQKRPCPCAGSGVFEPHGAGEAQYIVNAVLAYQNGAQAGDMPHAGQVVDYERIRQFVLQVIREHERQEAPHTDMAEEPVRPDAAEERERASFGFDEDALNSIMSSLEAFKR